MGGPGFHLAAGLNPETAAIELSFGPNTAEGSAIELDDLRTARRLLPEDR